MIHSQALGALDFFARRGRGTRMQFNDWAANSNVGVTVYTVAISVKDAIGEFKVHVAYRALYRAVLETRECISSLMFASCQSFETSALYLYSLLRIPGAS